MSSSAICRTVLLETAKPRPSEPATRMTSVFIPITCRVVARMSGPPLLPGLIAASVWIRSSKKMASFVSLCSRRPFPDSTPTVTLLRKSPSALPMAMTVAPIGASSLLPRTSAFTLCAPTSRTATSVSGSRPTRRAPTFLLSAKITSKDAPAPVPRTFETTWLFVRT